MCRSSAETGRKKRGSYDGSKGGFEDNEERPSRPWNRRNLKFVPFNLRGLTYFCGKEFSKRPPHPFDPLPRRGIKDNK
ncbi:MAG: hypothetical protein LBP62_03510 [Clostridiales bacterium]|nr:hypothetical protein [Clostridiales bacterium]